jgi:HEAT repeat protein
MHDESPGDEQREILAQRLRRGPPHLRSIAAEQIGELGPHVADWAVPLLSAALQDDGSWSEDCRDWAGTGAGGGIDAVQGAAAAALARMGPSGVEVLRHTLASGTGVLRARVASSLREAEPETLRQLAPELRRALEHRYGDLRAHALFALSRLDPRPTWLFEWLSTHHQDRHDGVRCQVAHALGGYGAPALPLIRRMMEDPNFLVAQFAAVSLATAAPLDQALSELLAIIRPGPARQSGRWAAMVKALAVLGPAATEALPLLEAHVHTGSLSAKRLLGWAIARISDD